MGSEFVTRKSSVWTKKSDTKPSLFSSRPFSVQTRQDNTVNKKELPSEIPPANYITDKMGSNAPQPTVQRQEDNSDKEQEPDLMSRSDESPVADEEEKISPSLEDENKEEKVNLKPAVEEGDEETISPQLEDENKQEDLQLAADEPEKEDMVSPQLENENKQEELNKKLIQTKLTVGEPGDKYEQEADTVAAKVVEHINSPKSQQPVQGKVEPVVQPTLMRQGGAGKGTVNRDVEQNIQQARGGGQGLADNVRQPMEQAFGADFSGVKVHTGGQADVLNRSLNSRAFATGQDIFFKQGEYNPGSRGGQELLAHELTHVVQQGGGIQTQIQRECGVDECCIEEPNASYAPEEPNLNPVDAGRDIAAGTGTVMEVEAILRTLYKRADKAIAQEGALMLSKGVPEEQVARWVIDARNKAKVKIRAWDLDVLRIMAERSNVRKYGDPVGPSYDQLRRGDPARNIKPRTDKEIIEGAKRTRPSVNRWVGRLRIAGRITIAIDIGIAAYKIASAPEVDRPRVLLKEVGGLAGAAAGGWSGAKLGGMVGGGIGAWFGGAGAAPGAAIGAIVGGIGGAIGGGLLGRKGGDLIADQLYPPTETGFEGGFQ